MITKLHPYIGFEDTTREALTFYQTIFGGQLDLRTFEEAGTAEDLADADKIMHGRLDTPGGMSIMGADTPARIGEAPVGSNISLLLEGDNEGELRGYWEKLCEGGKVAVELAPQLWGGLFGLCIDKFGVTWMVNITTDTEGGSAV